jgi:hypothetical protein
MQPRAIEFLEWLRHHRGLSERTIKLRGHVLRRLLLTLGDDPATYDADLVRRIIVEEAERGSRAGIGTVTTTLRGICGSWRRAMPVAVVARNDVRPDAQSRPIFDAH